MEASEREFLERAQLWFGAEVAPRAAALDSNAESLKRALLGLGRYQWLALNVSKARGGGGLSPRAYALYQAALARASGALAFLQTQHQSAASMIATGSNSAMIERMIPAMSGGELLVGIGYGHLRSDAPQPAVRVRQQNGGYVFKGEAPWVTGAGYFSHFVLGGTLPDGRVVFGLVPLTTTRESGSLELSEPLDMATMSHTNTVRVVLKDWLVSRENVVRVEPAGWMQQRDATIVARKAFFALGCARAGVDAIVRVGKRRKNQEIADAAKRLEAELNQLTRVLIALVGTPEEGSERALLARAEAVSLAARCAHTAVVATAGKANLADNPAQRVHREALLFTVLAQTRDLQTAVLRGLTGG